MKQSWYWGKVMLGTVKAVMCDVNRFGFYPVVWMNAESVTSPPLSLNHLRSHITGQYTNHSVPLAWNSSISIFKGECIWNKVMDDKWAEMLVIYSLTTSLDDQRWVDGCDTENG